MTRRIFGCLLALALAAGLGLAAAPTPHVYAAANLLVDPTANDANDANDGKCSLWEALQAISQGSTYNNCSLPGGASEPFTITFKSSGTLKVNNGTLPYVSKNVAITGPVIIEGNGNDTTMVVASSGILSLANLTMTKGNPAIIGQGTSAIINIAGCSFIGNKNDGDGGAINSSGKINIAGSAFTGNSADGTIGGGAIWASGTDTLAIAGTVFSGNVAKRSGGAIYATAPAALIDVIFNGNIANATDPNNNNTDGDPADNYDGMGGGAIFNRNDSGNDRKMTLTRAVFNGNITGQGHGGAIFNNSGATLEIEDSSFNGNLAGKPPSTERTGGAVVNQGGVLRITRSTLLNNAVVGDGGGLVNDRAGQATLSNVGFTANAATGDGAGIYNVNTQQGSDIRPRLTLLNVTLDLNAAQGQGGGIYAQAPTSSHPEVAHLTNTIVSGSDSVGGNCAGGGVQSQGNNLDSGTSCGFTQPGDRPSADAKLEGPSFNGGPLSSLLSQKTLAGSAAADGGDAAVCAAEPVGNVDVRGASRPKGATCDIGAFEAEPPQSGFGSAPVRPGPVPFGNVQIGQAQTADISVYNTGDAPLQLSAPALSGPNAADFALLTAFPLDVNAPTPLTLRCQPAGGAPGARAATFSFSTNDPQTPAVSFTLTCNATAQPVPGFGSTPAAPGPLDFGSVVVGQAKVASISFAEIGTQALTVNSAVLGGTNPGDFSVGVGINVTIADGGPAVVRGVSCTPAAPGVRSATLTLSTNDPTKPTVLFNLVCTGKTLPPLALDVPTATGSAGGLPTMDGPYGAALSPDGKHLYVAAQNSNSVHMFKRDPVTGALDTAPTQSFIDPGGELDGAVRVFVSADGANVYVTAPTSGRLIAYSRDLSSGLLTKLDSVANGVAYGCFPLPCDGQIAGLAGAFGLALSPDGQYLYVGGSATTASQGSAINVLRRGSNGDLVADPIPFTVGARFVQNFTHPNMESVYDIVVSPDGAYVYAASFNNNPDGIIVLKRNAQDGKLSYVTTVSAAQVAGLASVFRLAISPDGNHLYAASSVGDTVVAFERNGADGTLSSVATYADGGPDELGQTIDGLDGASAVAFSTDGSRVYITGRVDDSVAAFERDPLSGALVFIQAVKRSTEYPAAGAPLLSIARDVVVAPDGRAVYATGNEDDRVVTLRQPNPKPALESLSPASVTATADGISITVNGAGFVPGAVVRWNNAVNLSTTFVHSGKLVAGVGVGLVSAAGARTVTVINPAPGGGTSNALTFTVTAPATPTQPAENPVPSIDELIPAGVVAGGPAVPITVKGAGFTLDSVVRWNGQSRLTTFVSASTLQFQAPAADVAQPGDAVVTVVNPAPGGGASNAAAFGVAAPGENPVPAIALLSPASAVAGPGGVTELTVTGSGFVEGAQAQWDGEDRPTTFVSATELRVGVDAADLVAAGVASVQVVNPGPGGGPSNVAGFTVSSPTENPLPSLTGVVSAANNPDGSLTLTLAGSGFIGGSTARWNGQARATALVSSSRLTVTIAGADFAAGSATITVSNPAPGGGTSEELLYTVTRLRMPFMRK